MSRFRDDINSWIGDRSSKKKSHGWEYDASDDEEENNPKEKEELKEEAAKTVYKSVTKSSFIGLSRHSPYLFVNINYFAHNGGIKMLTDLVVNGRNIAIIAFALEILKDMYYYLEEKYAEDEVVEKIKKPLQALPRMLSDDEIKKSSKEDINKLLRLIEVSIIWY